MQTLPEDSDLVIATRQQLGVTQDVFARLVGVSRGRRMAIPGRMNASTWSGQYLIDRMTAVYYNSHEFAGYKLLTQIDLSRSTKNTVTYAGTVEHLAK
jgi:hypothetical protein